MALIAVMALIIATIIVLIVHARISISTPDCGISKKSSLVYHIIGGEQASPNQYPWMVAIVNDRTKRIDCTGFLIDRLHVMSAAHCFPRGKSPYNTLRLGNIDWRRGKTYKIVDIKFPPGYKSGRYYQDMVIITMDRPVKGSRLTPICLPPDIPEDMEMEQYNTAGWGITRLKGKPVNILRHLENLPLSPKRFCVSAFNNVEGFKELFPRGITNDMFCAGFLEGGKDGCEGDSGGPLMGLKNGRFYAVGIQSFGNECAKKGYPGGFARVADFRDFIQNALSGYY